mmetsp:Transcript_2982/g.4892  ORF Transcript_2982/g.4892 Transcript_2982/m.4892 type:complete len:283 (+) Transcript_2982:72-920(+)
MCQHSLKRRLSELSIESPTFLESPAQQHYDFDLVSPDMFDEPQQTEERQRCTPLYNSVTLPSVNEISFDKVGFVDNTPQRETSYLLAAKNGVRSRPSIRQQPYTYSHDVSEDAQRSEIIYWTKECCKEIMSSPDTFHLALNLFDRCIEAEGVRASNFSITLLLCIAIASKFIDSKGPSFQVFCSYGYSHDALVEREQEILILLDFNLMTPTLYSILLEQCEKLHLSDQTKKAAIMLLDRSLPFLPCTHLHTYELARQILFRALHIAGACYYSKKQRCSTDDS